MENLIGKKVQLIRLEDPYINLKQGDMGTIISIEDNQDLGVDWDNGMRYNLCPKLDEYEIIESQIQNEKKSIKLFSEFFLIEKLENSNFHYATSKVEEFSDIFTSDSSIESKFRWEKKNSGLNILIVNVEYKNLDIQLEYSYQWTIDTINLEIHKVFFSNQPDVQEYSQEEKFQTIEECMDWLRQDLMDYIRLYENNQNYFLLEKNSPTNPKLWAACKSWAKSRYEVWPSAYAVGAAAKRYKSKGGGWRKSKTKKKK